MAELDVASWSRARRRHRPIQAKVRSITQRRGCTAKPRCPGFDPRPAQPPCADGVLVAVLVAAPAYGAALGDPRTSTVAAPPLPFSEKLARWSAAGQGTKRLLCLVAFWPCGDMSFRQNALVALRQGIGLDLHLWRTYLQARLPPGGMAILPLCLDLSWSHSSSALLPVVMSH
jgi:hypothetical protein